MNSLLAVNSKNFGTQRCYLGHELMSRLSLKIGSTVTIRNDDKLYICISWPRHDSFEKYIDLDKYVEYKAYDKENSSNRALYQKCSIVQPVETIWASTLTVFVVLENSNLTQTDLIAELHETLNGLRICKGCRINAGMSHVGRLYGIHAIFVEFCENFDNPNASVFEVTKMSQISVRNIVSSEWFNLKPSGANVSFGGLFQPRKELTDIANLVFTASNSRKIPIANVVRCVLLKGPPGCGKTLLITSIAKHFDAALFDVRASEIFGNRAGEGEEKIRLIFEKALRLAAEGPCVMHIHDIDVICGGKDGHKLSLQLAQMLDDLFSYKSQPTNLNKQLLIIATTYRPTFVSEFLRRGNRFDKEVTTSKAI